MYSVMLGNNDNKTFGHKLHQNVSYHKLHNNVSYLVNYGGKYLMEIFCVLCYIASQEGEQRGDELGAGGYV